MRQTFNIKKGKNSFNGIKIQELCYPLILLVFAIIFFVIPTIEFKFAILSLFGAILLYSFALWKLSDLEIEVRFSPKCLYEGGQINRLFGLKEGFKNNHMAMFGWKCVNKKILQIVALTYVDGNWQEKRLMDCSAEEWLKLDLYLEKDKYVFVGESKDGEKARVSMARKTGFRFSKLFMNKLFPRFGDSTLAPHAMSIEVVEKEK